MYPKTFNSPSIGILIVPFTSILYIIGVEVFSESELLDLRKTATKLALSEVTSIEILSPT